MRLAIVVILLSLLLPVHTVLAEPLASTPQPTAKLKPKPLLLGLFVDTTEKDPVDALKIADDYYIPFDVFTTAIGIQPSQVEAGWAFDTPIGKSVLPHSALTHYQGTSYLNIAATKVMGIPIQFNQSTFAIGIYPPWSTQDINAKKPTKKAAPKIDYYPETAGLNHININGGINHYSSNSNKGKLQKNLQIGLAGHAFGGLWGGLLQYNQAANQTNKQRPVDINRLYWANFSKHAAIRIGTNANPSFNTGSNQSFSGVNVAYSNRDIGRHLATFNQYNSTLLQNNFNDYRTISGEGPSGGVAELRINGRGIARVRIGLDKYYEFINLNVNQLYDAQHNIEVALYEHNFANQPLKVIPYNLAKRQSNVATGEVLIEAGAGKLGNILKKDQQNNKNHYYTYIEYGLHNNIAIRAGINKTDKLSGLLGVNFGLSPNINWDIAYKKQAHHHLYDSVLSYEGKKFGANWQFSYQQQHKKPKKTNKRHSLYLHFRPTDAVHLALNAHQNKQTGKPTERYFTANANIRFNDNVYASIHRDRHNDMSYQLNWNLPKYKTNLAFSSDKNQYGLSVDHQLLPQMRIGAEWKRPKKQRGNWYKGYLEYQINDNGKLYANATRHLSATEYQIGWQQRINQGVDFSMGFQRTQGKLSNFNQGKLITQNNRQNYFYLQFNIALMRVPNSGYTFSQAGSGNNGRLIANIHYDKNLPIESKDILLKLNGKGTQATLLSQGKYLIDNLKPGVYQLSLDSQKLPIEYSTDSLAQPTVKIANAATTVVPYTLEKRLGFSGKIQGIGDSSKAVTVDIYQGDTKITSVQSNDFGYYQVLGLKPSEYTIKAQGYRSKKIKLVDDFVFEVDLHK